MKAIPVEEQTDEKPKVPDGLKPMEEHLYGLDSLEMKDLVPDYEGRAKRVLNPPHFDPNTKELPKWGMMGDILRSLKKKK